MVCEDVELVKCDNGPKTVSALTCGDDSCDCKRCKHSGFQCYGECIQSDPPNACEPFQLLFCRPCLPDGKASLYLSKRCEKSKRLEVEIKCGRVLAKISAGQLSEGHWQVSLVTKSRQMFSHDFYIKPCPISLDEESGC